MTATKLISEHPDIKLNVGCGLTPTPGWLNYDNSLSVRAARFRVLSATFRRMRIINATSAELAELGRTGSVRYANAAVSIPCVDGLADAVYSSHMIEHLDRSEARAFLSEVRRVLRPGGVIRLAAPDLSRLVTDYLTTGDADRFVASSHMGLDRPSGLRAWVKWAIVGPRHHLWMYDGDSLSRLLNEAGFADAAIAPLGCTRIAEPGQLDLRERAEESVYVEAVKPR